MDEIEKLAALYARAYRENNQRLIAVVENAAREISMLGAVRMVAMEIIMQEGVS